MAIGSKHFSTDLVRDFLTHLQNSRGCQPATCNQRLAAIHGLAQFIAWKSPEHIEWASQVKAVPMKKSAKTSVPYLERAEIDAILSAPDPKTRQGFRDHTLLLFLYNTGARVSEAANLKISDLDLKYSVSVRILGKGDKVRHCPLWKTTVALLEKVIHGRPEDEPVFLNRKKQPITRFGIHTLVERYVEQAKSDCASLERKRISPHTFRHTTAVHLLRAGVDINTIRAWLGHVSIDTTNIYAEVDLEMKSKALALCDVGDENQKGPPRRAHWKEDRDLMAYLRSL